MMDNQPIRTEADRAGEIAISLILRVGVTLSAAVLTFGLLLFLLGGGGNVSLHQILQAPSGGLGQTVVSAIKGMAQLNPLATVEIGVLLLLATPIFRVGASIMLFLVERDWLYVVITATVFAILLLSVLDLH